LKISDILLLWLQKLTAYSNTFLTVTIFKQRQVVTCYCKRTFLARWDSHNSFDEQSSLLEC